MPSVYSPQLGCTFIHNPRTGGTSIGVAIQNIDNKSEVWWQHQEIPEEFIKKSKLTFSVVRNPWDRTVSSYHFFREGALHRDEIHSRRLRETLLKENNLEKFPSFEDWIEIQAETKFIVPKEIIHLDILSQQEDIVKKADEILKFETLEKDLQRIEKMLNFNLDIQHNYNVSTRDKDYRTYYSERTKKLVGDHFHRDIVKFKYTF